MFLSSDDRIFDESVTGYNLDVSTLREALSEEETLLVFLRHFG